MRCSRCRSASARSLPSSIFVSTVAEGGLEPLRRALASAIRQRRPLTRDPDVAVRRTSCSPRSTATGEVLDQRMDGERLVVKARVDDVLAGRLRRAGAEVTNGTGRHRA